MSSYVLDQHDRIPVARRPLRVEAATVGAARSVDLVALCGQREDPTARLVRPGVLILPMVEERTEVRVRPSDGRTTFPDGTVVTLRLITEEARGGEPDVITVQAVDVSKLDGRNVVAVEPVGDRLVVSALNAIEDVPLGELASAARSTARAALGIDRVPAQDALHVVVGLDVSTSMAPVLADGSVAAAIDVVVGVAHVIGEGKGFNVCLVDGDQPDWQRPVPVTEVATKTVEAAVRLGLGCGFASAPGVLRGTPREPTVMYVLTDGRPADAPDLAAAGAREGDVRHVLVINGEDTRLPGRPYASRLRTRYRRMDATQRLLGPGPMLTELVHGLLRGCFAAGSPLAERVARG